jgi:signal transduction histidine kinase
MSVREAQPESVEVHCILDNVYRTGKTAELHEIPVTLGDKLRYFNLTYAARFDAEKNISGVMILGTEVTEQVLNRLELQRAKELAQNANESKTRFLANISHEIRTPLSAILGFGELLRNYIQNHPQGLDYINRISRNASQLSRLIDELLDLSKIEVEKLEVEHEKINLDTLLEDVLSTLKLRAQEKSIDLSLKWVSAKPTNVVADPLRVSQILSNVIGNAVKFTLRGSIRVELSASNGQLTARIIDTGIGMTAEEQSRIFSPFVQADTSVTRKYGGSGLGLALSRKLAQLLGGDLTLEKSIPESGTTFKIEINIANTVSETKKSAQKSIVVSDQPLFGKKVLIVDDAPDNRVIANIFLQNAGAECEEAEDGQEGIDRAMAENFDIILMDIQMPVLDGYQAMEKLTQLSYKKPVIALTAHALNDEKQRCLNAGFTDYVTKPINRTHLIQSILQAL